MNCPLVSIVVPVYNVGDFLCECLDSLACQTVSDIEIICVDDGSTDDSPAILDKYAAQDGRFQVVHCPNEGANKARNKGLDMAHGEYLYTCDADDICHPRLLEILVRRARMDGADIVCCERSSFDCDTGKTMGRLTLPEWLWSLPRPFSGRDIARDLFCTFGNSTCDKLFRRAFIEGNGLRFLESVRRYTSSYFTSLALALASRISLAPDSLYRYRENRPGSLQTTREKSPRDAFLSRTAIAEELKRRGVFEVFELSFLVSLVRSARAQLRGARRRESRIETYRTTERFVCSIISRPGFPMLDFATTAECAWWRGMLESGGPGEWQEDGLRKFQMGSPFLISVREWLRAHWTVKKSGIRPGQIASFGGIRLQLDFLVPTAGGLRFEGMILSDRADAKDVFRSLSLVSETDAGEMSRSLDGHFQPVKAPAEYLGRVEACRFAIEVPVLPGERQAYRWRSSMKGITVDWRNAEFSRYFPLARHVRFSYARIGGMLLSIRGDALVARPASALARARAETLLCLNLVRKHSRVAMKALALRWIVRFARMFRRRPLWLFSDRIDHADDNGRAMFEYVTSLPASENPPECAFAISRKAPEAAQLGKFGRIVDIESFRYKLAFLLSDCVVSAYHTRMHRFPFDDLFAEYAKDLVLRPRFMQLRHGVCQNDTSRVQNRWFDNASFVATVSEREQKSMTTASYGYSTREVRLTGFPRYDLLGGETKKVITLMPTWRAELIDWDERGRHKPSAAAARSSFVGMYGALLSDAGFIDRCERAGFRVQVKAHPNLSPVLPLIKADSRVRFLDKSTAYREVFAETSLLVTDYSSVAFDFAYLRKPVIYFQFDRAEYFGATYGAGYFDCARDGFGPVVSSVEDLRQAIVAAVESGCRLHAEYRGRIDAFFAFNDRGNRRRVYEAILDAANRP